MIKKKIICILLAIILILGTSGACSLATVESTNVEENHKQEETRKQY